MIIVGGRPAGATLAARLGARGLRVLVVDRASFPSQPAVPSSAVLYPGSMAILDDLGIDEASYVDEHSRMFGIRFGMAGIFEVSIGLPAMAAGRNYFVGLDRAGFDARLWRNLERFPSVERREGFAVADLLRDGATVIGVVGAPTGETPQEIRGRVVIGADGRFSQVARKAGAEVVEDASRCTSTVYFAQWRGVRPPDEARHSAMVYATGRGLDVLFFAEPGGVWSINTHARSDRVDIAGDAQNYYLSTLRGQPRAWGLLAGAEQVSPVVGVKRIANGYRRAGGPGWALVGDALHYKDPVDGQGIYDALIEARLLDRALGQWFAGERSWAQAIADYDAGVRAATHAMFEATTARLARELYSEPPRAVIRTIIRWTMSDPRYQECFMRVLGRDVPPSAVSSRALLGGAILRGIGRDLGGLVRGRGRA